MDQIQEQFDPEIAQEVIALLSKKVTNLRTENGELQSQLSRGSVKAEGEAPLHGDSRHLLEEIEHLKSELERRPDPEEVAGLKKKLEKSKRRRRESVEQLRAELEEARSAGQTAKEALEKELKKLRKRLDKETREKEEALASLAQRPQSDDYDVHSFLSGALEELPPMPNPTVATGEGGPRHKGVVIKQKKGKFILAVNGDNTIKWANEGGGCVVPFPPVVYNGKRNAAVGSRGGTIENRSYELFGVGKRCVYYGTYRCIKVASMDWDTLKSLGQEFTKAFLETAVAQDGHAAPVMRTLMKSMYESGILKAGCAALRWEGVDTAIAKEVKSTNGPSTLRNMLIHNGGGKRRRAADDNGGGGPPSKKPHLEGKQARAERARRIIGTRHKAKK